MYFFVYTYIYIYIYIYVYLFVYIYMSVYICIPIHIYVFICIYIYIYMFAYVHLHICIFMYIFTYTYMYMYIYIQHARFVLLLRSDCPCNFRYMGRCFYCTLYNMRASSSYLKTTHHCPLPTQAPRDARPMLPQRKHGHARGSHMRLPTAVSQDAPPPAAQAAVTRYQGKLPLAAFAYAMVSRGELFLVAQRKTSR